MQKTLSLLLLLTATFIATSFNAQAPNGINYQAVIRTSTGTLASNQPVVIRARILQTTANGTAVYSERHNLTTDQFGLVNFVIGNGVFLAGNPFANLNWGNGPYFLELGVAFTNQVNPVVYMPYGTQQMMSVPYALYAKSSGNLLNQWSSGNGVPQSNFGTTGDYYLDNATGNVYTKTNGTTWVLITNITGPQGVAGAVGPQGPVGIQGVAGPPGNNAVGGPMFITPSLVYQINSEYGFNNSITSIDFDTLIGQHVNTIILYYENNCTSGMSSSPVKCQVDVLTNGINYEIIDNFHGSYSNNPYPYGNNSGQIFLPLGQNGIITFTNNIIRSNLKIYVIGYFP